MAIGWLSVLRMVPWADVISNAPKVAEGAKKLWNAVNKKSPSPDLADEEADVPADAGLDTLATLQARLATMEIATADLHSQMLASSELIKVLADQNAQLIKRMEVHRIRIVWLAGATVVFGIIAVIGLILAVAS
jgi:hypothetical protein